MAVKAKVQALDGVDEALRAHYAEGEDGAFYFAVEGIEDMPAFVAQRTKTRELLDEKKTLQRTYEALIGSVKGAGLDPDDPETFKAVKQATKDREGKETTIELLQKEHARKMEEIQHDAQKRILSAEEAAQREQAAARDYFRDAELTSAITKAKGRPHMLLRELREKIEVERDEGGQYRAWVRGPGGEKKVKDSQGNFATLEDLVADYRNNAEWGGAFEPTGAGGSGATGGNGGAGSGGRTVRSGDREAFGANLEAIARGEIKVV